MGKCTYLYNYNLASLHFVALYGPGGKHSRKIKACSYSAGGGRLGWDGPGRDGGLGWVGGRVTVGLAKGTGVEVYCIVERSLLSCRRIHSGEGRKSSYWVGGVLQGGAEDRQLEVFLLSPVSGATTTDQDSDFRCCSSVGDSVSLITTAFVTSMSGCCCLASWIAMARA